MYDELKRILKNVSNSISFHTSIIIIKITRQKLITLSKKMSSHQQASQHSMCFEDSDDGFDLFLNPQRNMHQARNDQGYLQLDIKETIFQLQDSQFLKDSLKESIPKKHPSVPVSKHSITTVQEPQAIETKKIYKRRTKDHTRFILNRLRRIFTIFKNRQMDDQMLQIISELSEPFSDKLLISKKQENIDTLKLILSKSKFRQKLVEEGYADQESLMSLVRTNRINPDKLDDYRNSARIFAGYIRNYTPGINVTWKN